MVVGATTLRTAPGHGEPWAESLSEELGREPGAPGTTSAGRPIGPAENAGPWGQHTA